MSIQEIIIKIDREGNNKWHYNLQRVTTISNIIKYLQNNVVQSTNKFYVYVFQCLTPFLNTLLTLNLKYTLYNL